MPFEAPGIKATADTVAAHPHHSRKGPCERQRGLLWVQTPHDPRTRDSRRDSESITATNSDEEIIRILREPDAGSDVENKIVGQIVVDPDIENRDNKLVV